MGLEHPIHLVTMDERETIGRWIAGLPPRKEGRDHTVADCNIRDICTEFDNFSAGVDEWDPRPCQIRQFAGDHPQIVFIIDTRGVNAQQNFSGPRASRRTSDRFRQSPRTVNHIGKRSQNRVPLVILRRIGP
ncbi:hypothetical protein GCM10010464_19250 [Pseudonocardia yunnanensis]